MTLSGTHAGWTDAQIYNCLVNKTLSIVQAYSMRPRNRVDLIVLQSILNPYKDILEDIFKEFEDSCYNILMDVTRTTSKQNGIARIDEAYLYWRDVMERVHDGIVDYVFENAVRDANQVGGLLNIDVDAEMQDLIDKKMKEMQKYVKQAKAEVRKYFRL